MPQHEIACYEQTRNYQLAMRNFTLLHGHASYNKAYVISLDAVSRVLLEECFK